MTDRPNIILVTWDSVRADHMSFHGYKRETTPTLATIAQNGLVYEDTQVPAVGTPASFSGMFTGRHAVGSMEYPYPDHWRQANKDRRFVQEALQEIGYYTAGFHFNALMSDQYGWGRGWDKYEDHLWTEESGTGIANGLKNSVFSVLQRLQLANFAVDTKRMVQGEPPARWEGLWADVEKFLQQAPEPFFLWVLLIDTHHPYYPPPEYHNWDQPGIRRIYALNFLMRRYRQLVGEGRASIINAYDNAIRYADAFLERLREELDRHGYGDDPLIVHSDHGDEFGEHGNYGHRPLMYDTVTRVPLVMENVGKTGRVPGPNSLLNLGSTILDLANSDERLANRASLLNNERQIESFAKVQNIMQDGKRMAAVVGEEWKTLYHPAGDWGTKKFPKESWEAYHRPSDPMEQENKWGSHPPELETQLRKQLNEKVPTMDDQNNTLEAGTEERLRELGYLE